MAVGLYETIRSAAEQIGSGVSRHEILQAEEMLGVSLPQSYQEYLKEVGWVSIRDVEIYGLGSDVPEYLDVVRVTIDERTIFEPRMPVNLVPFHNDGTGSHYCMDTSQWTGTECPVVLWDVELERGQVPVLVSPSFFSWLSERVKTALSG